MAKIEELEAMINGTGYTLSFGAWDDLYDSTRLIETITFADGTSRTIEEDEHLSNTSFNNVVSVTLTENDNEWWAIEGSGVDLGDASWNISPGETITLTLTGNAVLSTYFK